MVRNVPTHLCPQTAGKSAENVRILSLKIGNFRRPNAGTSPGIPGDSRTYPESPLTHQAPSEGIIKIGQV